MTISVPAGSRRSSLDYDCHRGGDQPTDCTSTIDICFHAPSLLQHARHHLNHRTLRAELTVRFPPFPLYEFAVIRS
jgi:hypothetical protein